MVYRYFIRLCYTGLPFHGWQRQKNAHSVQSEVECALQLLIKLESGITGCGRTDTGVNARIFYCHFDSPQCFSDWELQHLCYRLNKVLPDSVAILGILPVQPGAHARFSAVSRTYEYVILLRKDPFLISACYLFPHKLNIDLMNQGGNLLHTIQDFASFSKTGTQVSTNICYVTRAEWIEHGNQLTFTITADRFLRNMVRAIVGTMIDLGRGKITMTDFIRIIESKNRGNAGTSVPAKGLYLDDIRYPDGLFLDSPKGYLQDSPHEIIAHQQTDHKFHEGAGYESYE
jgi:tRNA pseudouridine38-40 synthase